MLMFSQCWSPLLFSAMMYWALSKFKLSSANKWGKILEAGSNPLSNRRITKSSHYSSVISLKQKSDSKWVEMFIPWSLGWRIADFQSMMNDVFHCEAPIWARIKERKCKELHRKRGTETGKHNFGLLSVLQLEQLY